MGSIEIVLGPLDGEVRGEDVEGLLTELLFILVGLLLLILTLPLLLDTFFVGEIGVLLTLLGLLFAPYDKLPDLDGNLTVSSSDSSLSDASKSY